MNAPPKTVHPRPPLATSEIPPKDPTSTTAATPSLVPPSPQPASSVSEITETIQIPHTYTFAGETHTTLRTVPRSAPAAVAYLSSQSKSTGNVTNSGPSLRRPLARKGLLDPNSARLIKGQPAATRTDLPSTIGGNGARAILSKVAGWDEKGNRKGKKKEDKLNTVEKSKLDWEGVVEREGLREELEKAEKSGGSYLGRMEFLGRVGEKGEEEARRARVGAATAS